MLGINTVPSLGDPQSGGPQEFGNIAKNQLVNLFSVEDIDREPVLVRIAEREFATGCLRDEAVNAPSFKFRRLGRYPLLERRQRTAHTERRIETEREAGGEGRPQPPVVRLRRGSQHLQLDAGQARLRVHLRIQRLEIVSAADNHALRSPGSVTGLDPWRLNSVYGAAKAEFDSKSFVEI